MPAADRPTGEIVETTTRRRVVPVSDSKPDIWETLYHLAANPHEWERHMVYIYRMEPDGTQVQVTKGKSILEMPITRQQVPVADKDELEFALRDVSGGNYRVLLKEGPQLKCAGQLKISGPIRPAVDIIGGRPVVITPGANPNPAQSASYGVDPTAAVASRAFDALSSQERTAAEIGFAAMRTGLDAVTKAVDLERRAPAQDDLTRQLMTIMIQRMMEDPTEKLVRLLALMREMNGGTGGAGQGSGAAGSLVDKLLNAAADRLLNPAPTGAPVSATAELVRSLPSLGSHFVEGVKAYADARRSEVQIMAMSRANPAQPMPPSATVLPPVPAPPNGAPDNMEPVERKIIEIFQQPISAHQAADEAMAFLDTLAPNGAAITPLANLGEDGLLKFFGSRPILKAATANMPRLVEFIRAFLKMHAEDVAAENGQQSSVEVKPPLPN
jgi:hypothetical protein